METGGPATHAVLLGVLLDNICKAASKVYWSTGKGANMANSAWKRLEKTPGYRRKKRFFKRLIGKELWLRNDIEIPVINDGGWLYSPEGLDAQSIIYSLGVGDEIDFDLAMIQKFGAEVHAFDPTPSSIELIKFKQVPERFVFHPWAVTAANGTLTFFPRLKKDGSMSDVNFTLIPEEETRDAALTVPAYSLSTICEKLDHSKIDLMKMNIEGSEYEVLEGLLSSPIKPRQLLVEFHHRFPGIGLKKTANMIDQLRNDGYMIIAVSETGRSVSFMRQ